MDYEQLTRLVKLIQEIGVELHRLGKRRLSHAASDIYEVLANLHRNHPEHQAKIKRMIAEFEPKFRNYSSPLPLIGEENKII